MEFLELSPVKSLSPYGVRSRLHRRMSGEDTQVSLS